MDNRRAGRAEPARQPRSRLLASFTRYAVRTPGAGALNNPALCGGVDWRTLRFAGSSSGSSGSSSSSSSSSMGHNAQGRRAAEERFSVGAEAHCYAHVRDRHAFDPSLNTQDYAEWMLQQGRVAESAEMTEIAGDAHASPREMRRGDPAASSAAAAYHTRSDDNSGQRAPYAGHVTPLPRQRTAANCAFAKEYLRLGGHHSTQLFQRTLRQYILDRTPAEINRHAQAVAVAATKQVVAQDIAKHSSGRNATETVLDRIRSGGRDASNK